MSIGSFLCQPKGAQTSCFEGFSLPVFLGELPDTRILVFWVSCHLEGSLARQRLCWRGPVRMTGSAARQRARRSQASLVFTRRPIPSTTRQPSGLSASDTFCCTSSSQAAASIATFAGSTVVLIRRACRIGASHPSPSVSSMVYFNFR